MSNGARRELYERLGVRSLAPLWEVLANLVTPEPRSACVPALWKYADVRPLLLEAGDVITAEEAERRVLVLENPGIRGASQITQSLYAGVQIILPGEMAASHRHAASALRFVLESDGAYTDVEGARAEMLPGDLILTPSWTFHDHGNPGRKPAIWLDGLDVPMVNLFDASFAEKGPLKPPADPRGVPSRYRYPYSAARAALESMIGPPADSRHGFKMRYGSGPDASWPVPTIAAFLQLLPSGFVGVPYRSTDGTVFCCVEGQGRSRVGDAVFEWSARDLFVVPSWTPISHEASTESVLFSFSDRAAQQGLGLWREDLC